MITQYILTSKTFTGEIKYEYLNGILNGFKIECELHPDRVWRFVEGLKNYVVEMALVQFFNGRKDYILKQVPADITFETFWNRYNYKVGNKGRAEKLYNLLPDADKIKCLESIKGYDGYLLNKQNIEKLYPETFLSQQRYNSTFSL